MEEYIEYMLMMNEKLGFFIEVSLMMLENNLIIK